MNCLSEDDVVRFVTGGLSQAAIAPIDLHIDGCRNCRLLVSAFASQTGNRPRAPESLCTFAPGDELAGRYIVRSLLGVGGMGEVYEVLDAVLGETVALKTIAVSVALDADGVARFKAEVQMARRVTHPNVCRVFDVGFHASPGRRGQRDSLPAGIPFLTMELLRGETLRARLQRSGALPPAEAMQLVSQIAAGLNAAHEAGVTHGDLKSENVMLVSDPKLGSRVLLTDFGLARQVDGRSLRLFEEDPAVAGTMGYMAPEQFQGRPASPASDIYALGVVFFELLTGRLPYDVRAMLTERARSQWIPPPPPSLRGLGVMVPALWDGIVGRCVARDPGQRFGNARAFLEALDGPRPRPRRRRWLLAVAGAAALGALLSTAVSRSDRRALPVNVTAMTATTTSALITAPATTAQTTAATTAATTATTATTTTMLPPSPTSPSPTTATTVPLVAPAPVPVPAASAPTKVAPARRRPSRPARKQPPATAPGVEPSPPAPADKPPPDGVFTDPFSRH